MPVGLGRLPPSPFDIVRLPLPGLGPTIVVLVEVFPQGAGKFIVRYVPDEGKDLGAGGAVLVDEDDVEPMGRLFLQPRPGDGSLVPLRVFDKIGVPARASGITIVAVPPAAV